jgi:hypothetical protein
MNAFIDDYRADHGGEPSRRHAFETDGAPDLQCPADLPVDLSRPCRAPRRSRDGTASGSARR